MSRRIKIDNSAKSSQRDQAQSETNRLMYSLTHLTFCRTFPLTLCGLNGEKSPNSVKICRQPNLMKWNNIVTVNIVPIFKRGLPRAVPTNMHLGFEGNIFGKILTPQNEAKIGTHI